MQPATNIEAERQLKVAIGLDPDKADAYYYLGATYLQDRCTSAR